MRCQLVSWTNSYLTTARPIGGINFLDRTVRMRQLAFVRKIAEFDRDEFLIRSDHRCTVVERGVSKEVQGQSSGVVLMEFQFRVKGDDSRTLAYLPGRSCGPIDFN